MTHWVVSFPKSGRTWLRHIMAQYGLERDATKKDMLRIRYHGKLVMFRHWRRFPNHRHNARVLWLHRDELDTFNSYYWHTVHRTKVFVNLSPLEVADITLPMIVEYNAYWKTLADHEEVLELTYEDMFSIEALFDVLESFLDRCRLKWLQDAYDRSTFDEMRSKERSGPLGDGILECPDHDDLHAFKTRKGKVGGFYVEQVEYADDISALWASMRVGEVRDKAVMRAMRDIRNL